MGFNPNLPKLKIVEDLPAPKEFTLVPNTQWREVDATWKAAEATSRAHDYIYQLCLHGANSKLIAGRFSLDVKKVEEIFGETIRKAQSELAMLLIADQIESALNTTNPQMKIHAGKQFAAQQDQPIQVTDNDGNAVEFEVSLVRKVEHESTGKVE